MIFLGTRFFLSPEAAESAFGISFNQQGDNSFHYIKGIRDIFSGIVLCVLVLLKERRALRVTMFTGTIIPLVDMLIVLSKDYNGIVPALSHISAIVVCSVSGAILLFTKSQKQRL